VIAPRYDDLLGLPFVYGGRVPHSLDCFGLVKELHRRVGIEIREQDSPAELAVIEALMHTEAVSGCWEPCEMGPMAVLMFAIPERKTRELRVCHIGVQLTATDFIHTWAATGGPTVERIADWKHRIAAVRRYKS
jgi:hypothetical protein